jgi:oligopeptide transport system permease protein
MTTYVLQRLGQGLLTLWVIATLSFSLMRLAPGGPFDQEKPLAPQVQANLSRTYGLGRDVLVPADLQGAVVQEVLVKAGQEVLAGSPLLQLQGPAGKPLTWLAPTDLTVVAVMTAAGQKLSAAPALVRRTAVWEQYWTSLQSWARLDLGVTYASAGTKTVMSVLAASFPVSLELGLYALVLALLLGVGVGLVAGMYRNTWLDHLSMAGALLAVSLSSLVLGPLLVLVFGVWLQWLPFGGWEAFAFANGQWQVKILPTATLALVYAAWFARLTRAGMVEVASQPWIRTARAKGLPELHILLRHALKPAILPALSFLGPALAGIVTGSVVVERVFAIPGLGEHFVTAAVNRDYPLVMGTVLLYSALLIVANLLVDLTYALVDPRVRVT